MTFLCQGPEAKNMYQLGVCWLQAPVTHQANLKKRGICFKAFEEGKKGVPQAKGEKKQLDF